MTLLGVVGGRWKERSRRKRDPTAWQAKRFQRLSCWLGGKNAGDGYTTGSKIHTVLSCNHDVLTG